MSDQLSIAEGLANVLEQGGYEVSFSSKIISHIYENKYDFLFSFNVALRAMQRSNNYSLKKNQFENLIKFLLTVSKDEVVGYLLHVLDIEYNLSDSTKENKAAELFLSDKRFHEFRETIFGHVDDEGKKGK